VASNRNAEILVAAGREVAISNVDKLLFPKPKYTKLDLARYYLAVSEGALRGAGGRPNMLVRYPEGIDGEHFYQKRAPKGRRRWPGSRTSVASSCTRTRCGPRISSTPTSCALTSTPCLESRGGRCRRSLW